MEEKSQRNIFKLYFNFMIYLGCWSIQTANPVKKFLYFVYSNLIGFSVYFVLYLGVLDFIDSLSDMNKLFYNVSFSPLVMATWCKKEQTVRKSKKINALCKKLERSLETCKDQEERDICEYAVRDICLITKIFLFFLIWLYPTWIILSVCGGIFGERHLPYPAKLPGDLDINDPSYFNYFVVFQTIFSLIFLFEALSLELSFFGLLVQIYREYRFLIKKIYEFGLLHDESQGDGNAKGEKYRKPAEINGFLKKARDKRILREIIKRQKELVTFTEEIEDCYNISMFIHIFVGGGLLVVTAFQALIVSMNFNAKMGYQLGYVVVILCDMLYLCWLCNRISIKCSEVGTALYMTPWYKMDVNIQKDICLVILRSQKPPRITSGNFVELNLNTFMGMLKNVYSWLTLFRQVALK